MVRPPRATDDLSETSSRKTNISLLIFDPEYLSRYSDGLLAGRTGFSSQQEQDFFLQSAASRPVLKSDQPLIQIVPRALSPGVNRPGRKTDHSPPSSTDVKNDGAIPPLPHTSSWRGA
jgi:hypothetical protein